MPLLVRLSDARVADDLIAALDTSDTEVRRPGARTIIVDDGDDLEAELLFFLKACALSEPALTFELDHL